MKHTHTYTHQNADTSQLTSLSFSSTANSGVTNLLAQGNGATVMTIAWSPPANRHGFIDHYRVAILNNVAELRNLTRIVTDTMYSFSE